MEPTSGETFREQLDELRCHDTSWLRHERTRVVTDQRRLKLRELALTKVLDERAALDPMPDASVPAHTTKATVEVARSLESLPALAAARRDGRAVLRAARAADPDRDPRDRSGVGAPRPQLHSLGSAEAGAAGAEAHRGRRPSPLPSAPRADLA